MTSLRSKMARVCLFVNVAALLLNVSLLLLRFNVSPVSRFFAGEAVSRDERQMMMDTFAVLVDVLDSSNITYFMYGGTLIGSVRHHGMIPWDDDIDIIVAAENRSAVRKILNKMSPRFLLYTPSEDQKTMLQWKFYSSSASHASLLPKHYGWPYVDIFFFEENATHIWDLEPEYHEAGFVWSKSSVFPLVRRPFGGFTVPAPCNAIAFVAANYRGADSSSCASPSYNHRVDTHLWHSSHVLPCSHLWHVFPFVFRTTAADGKTIETLKIGNWTLQSHIVSPDTCSKGVARGAGGRPNQCKGGCCRKMWWTQGVADALMMEDMDPQDLKGVLMEFRLGKILGPPIQNPGYVTGCM